MKRPAFAKIICVLAAVATLSGIAQAQTQGMDRRDDRRNTRGDARDEKRDCKAGDEKTRAECRHEKRDTKQNARHGTDTEAAPAENPAQ
jgi:hypothetical protein